MGEAIIAYTDGCALTQNYESKWSGYGCSMSYRGTTIYGNAGFLDATAPQMELSGAIAVLRTIKQDYTGDVVLYSDSAYLVDGVNKYLSGWKKNDWHVIRAGVKGTRPIKNLRLWMNISEQVDRFGSRLRFVHVPAHFGVEGNEVVDLLAKRAAYSMKDGTTRSKEHVAVLEELRRLGVNLSNNRFNHLKIGEM